MQFRKAERKQLKARISVVGASGHGKTRAALKLAYGLVKDWDKIIVADTEYRSSEMLVGTNYDGFEIGQFIIGEIDPPYTIDKFMDAIESAEQELKGDGVLILDTFTHEWEGEGGLIDEHADLGGQFHHWKEPKKKHSRLIERIMHSPLHIITTVRAKQEYVLEPNERGKMEPKKVGIKPQQSNDYDHLFTTVFLMHEGAYATVTKDRTHLFNGFNDQISVEHGEMFYNWLVQGKPVKSLHEQRIETIQFINQRRLENEAIQKVITDYEAKARTKIEKWNLDTLLRCQKYLEENFPENQMDSEQETA